MEHLRLLGVSEDGSRLLLEGPDGTPYALPLDERVHAALRGDRARLGQLQIELENQITPREIQARIRAGQTSEEIAVAAQVPVERVRRFEGPVLMERQHITELAQTTNVRRVTDASAHPLEDVVLERLQARGVDPDDLTWDARRREDGRWAVRLEYLHGGRSRTAVWLFDHQRRTLEPHDDEASWLIGDERAVPEPTRAQRGRGRPTRPVGDPAGTPDLGAAAGPDNDETDERDQDRPALRAVPDVDEPEADGSEADGSEADGSEAEGDVGPDVEDLPDGPVAGDEFALELETEPGPDPSAEDTEPDNPLRPTTQQRPSRSGRRATVPSWDEILFGGGSTPED